MPTVGQVTLSACSSPRACGTLPCCRRSSLAFGPLHSRCRRRALSGTSCRRRRGPMSSPIQPCRWSGDPQLPDGSFASGDGWHRQPGRPPLFQGGPAAPDGPRSSDQRGRFPGAISAAVPAAPARPRRRCPLLGARRRARAALRHGRAAAFDAPPACSRQLPRGHEASQRRPEEIEARSGLVH